VGGCPGDGAVVPGPDSGNARDRRPGYVQVAAAKMGDIEERRRGRLEMRIGYEDRGAALGPGPADDPRRQPRSFLWSSAHLQYKTRDSKKPGLPSARAQESQHSLPRLFSTMGKGIGYVARRLRRQVATRRPEHSGRFLTGAALTWMRSGS